jgi:hypothetical protein
MVTDTVIRATEAEMADLQRIIDADEAIVQHELSQEKRSALIAEIDRLQKRITKLRRKRDHFLVG